MCVCVCVCVCVAVYSSVEAMTLIKVTGYPWRMLYGGGYPLCVWVNQKSGPIEYVNFAHLHAHVNSFV